MKYFFDSGKKGTDPVSLVLAGRSFSSQKEYAAVIKSILAAARKKRAGGSHPIYSKEMTSISKHLALTEPTAWGGVVMKNVDVEKDFIRKLLVVGRGGVLGFEYHALKHEKLRVMEGSCLVVCSSHKKRGYTKGKITWKIARRGDRFEFYPYDEHGVIALSDCVIEETSTNHLDDIAFIYKV